MEILGEARYRSSTKPLDGTKFDAVARADYIFEFKDGETIYHKDRFNAAYQYTGEEQVLIKLKAVSL